MFAEGTFDDNISVEADFKKLTRKELGNGKILGNFCVKEDFKKLAQKQLGYRRILGDNCVKANFKKLAEKELGNGRIHDNIGLEGELGNKKKNDDSINFLYG